MDIKRLEREVYRSTWEDGLLDLFFGVGLLILALSWLGELHALTGLAPALLVPLWAPIRKRVTEPRMGLVRLTERRRSTERAKLFWLLGLGVMTLVVALLGFVLVAVTPGPSLEPGSLVAGLPAALLGVGALLVAAMLGLWSFALYGLVLLLAGGVVAVADLHPGWAFLGAGLLVLAVGLARLLRFLRANPIPTQQAV